jgi:hypothetical protein
MKIKNITSALLLILFFLLSAPAFSVPQQGVIKIVPKLPDGSIPKYIYMRHFRVSNNSYGSSGTSSSQKDGVHYINFRIGTYNVYFNIPNADYAPVYFKNIQFSADKTNEYHITFTPTTYAITGHVFRSNGTLAKNLELKLIAQDRKHNTLVCTDNKGVFVTTDIDTNKIYNLEGSLGHSAVKTYCKNIKPGDEITANLEPYSHVTVKFASESNTNNRYSISFDYFPKRRWFFKDYTSQITGGDTLDFIVPWSGPCYFYFKVEGYGKKTIYRELKPDEDIDLGTITF